MRRETVRKLMIALCVSPLALEATGCASSDGDEMSAEEALSLDNAWKGTYGFIGSDNGDLQELQLNSAVASGKPPPPAALAGGNYTAQVDVRVIDPAYQCPVELAPCTFNESGQWHILDDGNGKQKLVLKPSAGSAREYFTALSTTATTKVLLRVFRKGAADGPELRMRRRGNVTMTLTDPLLWGPCSDGYHSALVEPGNVPLPPGRTGTAAIRSRCVPNIANCDAIEIDAPRELMITHPSVVRDPVRARNTTGTAGVWTLGRQIRDMIPPSNPVSAGAAFRSIYVSMLDSNAPGVTFSNRPRSSTTIQAFLESLPKLADGSTIDLDRLHRTDTSDDNTFELVAIAYRPDLQLANADGPSKVGEGRFVYTRSDSHTLINEYDLPVLKSGLTPLSVVESRRIWAIRFRALGMFAPFSSAYRAQLERVTNAFAGQNVKTVGITTPNRNSISQLRTNDVELGAPWEVREFRTRTTDGVVHIVPVTTKENPAREVRLGLPEANGSALRAELIGLLAANQASVLAGTFTTPVQFLGSSADTFAGAAYNGFFSGSGIPVDVQNAYINTTCNGCHRNVTGATPSHGFTHIRQTSATIADASNPMAGQDRLSSFVNQDMTGRAAVFRGLLCQGSSGSGAAAGRAAGPDSNAIGRRPH